LYIDVFVSGHVANTSFPLFTLLPRLRLVVFLKICRNDRLEKAAGCVCYYLLMAKVELARLQLFRRGKVSKSTSFRNNHWRCFAEVYLQYLPTLVFARRGGKLEQAPVNAKKGKREGVAVTALYCACFFAQNSLWCSGFIRHYGQKSSRRAAGEATYFANWDQKS
jgi:hypothetical protein